MPKAKPDQLQAIRFELQDAERDTLNMIAAGTTFRNVGQGIGAILDPILDNLVSILGFIIAKEGIEWVLEAFDRAEERNQKEIQETEDRLYDKYVKEYQSMYGPNGSMIGVSVLHTQSGNIKIMKGSTYDDYSEKYDAKYGPGTSEYIRLGRLNLPPKLTQEEWTTLFTEQQANIPPLMTQEEFMDSIQEDKASFLDLLNPMGSHTIFGQPQTERGYQKAMWWQKYVGRPMRSAGSNIASSLKFW